MNLSREVVGVLSRLNLRFNSVCMLVELREHWGHDVSLTASVVGESLVWGIRVNRYGKKAIETKIYISFNSIVSYHDPEYALNSKFNDAVHKIGELLDEET